MILVGTAGWSYPDWEGAVYPRKKGAGFHPLRHLARYLDCVELNSSFYAVPNPDHARRWPELVAERERFRFTAKLQRTFTHEALPSEEQAMQPSVDEFLAGIEPLRSSGRLAALLVQFPLGFRYTARNERRLERIAEAFGHLRLVLELRHRSWFDRPAYAAIERLGYSLAVIDLPRAKDHPPGEVPAIGPVGYLRLHGRNSAAWFDAKAGRDQRYDYLYGASEITELAGLARSIASDRDETYVITNNHFSGKAVANALELLAALGGKAPLAPVELIEAFPELRDRVRPDGQATLF